jgi:hypothetical protein
VVRDIGAVTKSNGKLTSTGRLIDVASQQDQFGHRIVEAVLESDYRSCEG